MVEDSSNIKNKCTYIKDKGTRMIKKLAYQAQHTIMQLEVNVGYVNCGSNTCLYSLFLIIFLVLNHLIPPFEGLNNLGVSLCCASILRVFDVSSLGCIVTFYHALCRSHAPIGPYKS